MRLIFFITSIFICFNFINILKSQQLHNDTLPWLIHDHNVYFIDIRPNFTSNEMARRCLEEEMIFTIKESEVQKLTEVINEIYGKGHTFWTYHNTLRRSVIYDGLNNSYKLVGVKNNACAKLTSNDAKFHAEDCSVRLGLICQKLISGGTLFYENGTILSINPNEVKTFCDPHSNVYDKTLKFCLIDFF